MSMSLARLVTLMVVLVVSLTTLGTNAQTPTASAVPPVEELTGIQAAASRTYSKDLEAMVAATPDLGPEFVFTGLVFVSVVVLQFDTAANAATGYDLYSAGVEADIPSLAQGETPDVDMGEITDIGSQARMARLHTDSEGFESWLEFVTVQQDEYVFVVTSLTAEEAETGMATSVAAWMAMHGTNAGDEAIFAADGGSSGGIWGFMPPAGDAVLKGLIPIADEILHPTPAT